MRATSQPRPLKKIAVEFTTTTTLEHHIAAKAEQATWIEDMLQELSDNKNACVQAQKEENRRFWTYLCIWKLISINLPNI